MTQRFFLAILVGVVLVAVPALVLWLRRPEAPALPPPCREGTFEGAGYVACEIDLTAYEILLARTDETGKPYGTLEAFDKAMAARGTPMLLAMNAGMYHKDFSPVGLFIQNGHETAPLNLADGAGNFFLKPNGVFFIDHDGRAGVVDSLAYAQRQLDARLATQSGPMLVIAGQLHPRFLENGTSRYIRNGIGVRDDGTVVLAISQKPVSFGSFGRLFRDELKCPDALFLDGAISALTNGRQIVVGGKFPVGPILAVHARQ